MLDIPPDWTGGIDDFVETANTWLARLLPLDRAARPKDEVNARLVRHYTTVGLLALPTREGREARYDRRQLLQLLALRRVMADGLSGKALYSVLSGQDDDGLAQLAEKGVTAELEATATSRAPGDALSYLQQLKARQRLETDHEVATLHDRAKAPEVSTSLALRPFPVQRIGQPLLAFGVTAAGAGRMPRNLPSEPLPPTVTLRRVTPRPGLEITLGPDFTTPRSEDEWSQLLSVVRRALDTFDTT